jgi:hypothetical protein
MIDAFDMRYSHSHGISAFAPASRTTFMLGWRVGLHPADADGWEFVEWLERDLRERPERWRLGRRRVWRLVRRDAEGEWETSDSEAYVM